MISYPGNKQYFGNNNKYTAPAGTSCRACMNSLCDSSFFAFTSQVCADMKCVNNPYSNVTDTLALRCSPSATTPARPTGLNDFWRCWKFLQSHLVFPAPRNACLWLRGRVSRDHENRSIPSLNDPCYELATQLQLMLYRCKTADSKKTKRA